jgi:hypothetical protein
MYRADAGLPQTHHGARHAEDHEVLDLPLLLDDHIKVGELAAQLGREDQIAVAAPQRRVDEAAALHAQRAKVQRLDHVLWQHSLQQAGGVLALREREPEQGVVGLEGRLLGPRLRHGGNMVES